MAASAFGLFIQILNALYLLVLEFSTTDVSIGDSFGPRFWVTNVHANLNLTTGL